MCVSPFFHGWKHDEYWLRIWIWWITRDNYCVLAGYSANLIPFSSGGGSSSSLSCYSTITVSTHHRQEISSQPLTATVTLHSCDDKARGEEARHEVSCLQTGEHAGRLFSVSALPISLIYVIANTLRPFEAREIQEHLYPNRTQIVNLSRQERRHSPLSVRIKRAEYNR